MKNIKFITLLLLIMFTAVSLFAKGSQEKTERNGKEEVSQPKVNKKDQAAIVNGEGISLEELDEEVSLISDQMASSGQPIPAERKEEFRMQVLDSMISRKLLLDEAEERNIGLSEEDVNARIDEIKAQFPTEEEYRTALAQQGLTEDRLRKDLKDNLVIQELLTREVEDKIVISDQEARGFYDENPEQFLQPAQIQASHIILTLNENIGEDEKADVRKRLEEIKSRIESGEDFAQVAEETSEGPSAPRGGDLGYFSRGQMVKPFEDAAFALDIGELSEIVETQFGYHLITVTDKKPESSMEYMEAAPQIKEYLKQERTSAAFDDYLESLKDDADIEILIESEAS